MERRHRMEAPAGASEAVARRRSGLTPDLQPRRRNDRQARTERGGGTSPEPGGPPRDLVLTHTHTRCGSIPSSAGSSVDARRATDRVRTGIPDRDAPHEPPTTARRYARHRPTSPSIGASRIRSAPGIRERVAPPSSPRLRLTPDGKRVRPTSGKKLSSIRSRREARSGTTTVKCRSRLPRRAQRES